MATIRLSTVMTRDDMFLRQEKFIVFPKAVAMASDIMALCAVNGALCVKMTKTKESMVVAEIPLGFSMETILPFTLREIGAFMMIGNVVIIVKFIRGMAVDGKQLHIYYRDGDYSKITFDTPEAAALKYQNAMVMFASNN